MVTLATPLGLLGLAALAVPVWVHLVRKPGRIVRVASLRFLPKDRVPLKAVRLRDPWLFLLRCALIVALVLLLSGVRWTPEVAPSGRWRVLHPRAELAEPERRQWDNAGSEGFSEWAGAWAADRSAWSFVADLDRRVGPNSELVVFGPTEGGDARSLRPRLHNLRLRWVKTPAKPLVERTETDIERVALLVGPGRSEDARHVRAALEAVAEAIPSRLLLVNEAPSTVVLLGAVDLPSDWRPRRVFTDSGEGGVELPAARTLRVGENVYSIGRRASPGGGAVVWADSAGEALLTVTSRGGIEQWTWAGRFHPEWTAWVLSPTFARAWRAWLLQNTGEQVADRGQSLSIMQLLPRLDDEASDFSEASPRDLRVVVWWVLLGLVIVERWVAWLHRRSHVREGAP